LSAFAATWVKQFIREKSMQLAKIFSSLLTLVALCIGVAISGCAVVAPPPAPATLSLQQRIDAAHTRADHEKLEAYYRGEAATARIKAGEHREMIKAYERQVAGGRSNANMSTHCLSLIASYESIAADYERLAASHRQMADHANRTN
jgi:hypothetical protein